MQRKLLGIINVDFDATVQLLIIYCVFAGYLRKLHNTYYSGDQIKNEIGEACSTYRQERCLQCFGGETEGTRPLGRPRHRWESIIKINILEVGWGWTMNWIDLAQEWDTWQELVNAVMNLLVP
jgi:hypothetical protein